MGAVLATFAGPGIAFTDLLPLLVWLGATCVLLLLGSLVPRWPKGWYAGEPSFAPRVDSKAEDDGYIVTVISNASEGVSEIGRAHV